MVGAGLGSTAVTTNPVDLAGGGEQDMHSFEVVARQLADSGEVDALLLTGYFGGYAELGPEYETTETEVARALTEAARSSGKPLAVRTMYPRGPAASAFRKGGAPVYGDIGAAVAALAFLVRRAERRIPGVPVLPGIVASSRIREGYFEARELLAAFGLRFVEARRADSATAALEAASALGFPVVLKALGLEHKSDAGGVVLGISSVERLDRQLAKLEAAGQSAGYSVERVAPVAEGIELIVGARRDPRFGPLVLVGLGGVYTEILADVAVALAPIDELEAERLLRRLRGAPLLLGARGRPELDLAAAAAAIAVVSQVAAEHPEIAEIEVNPLLVIADRAIGLDARIVLGHRCSSREDGLG
jgi:acyl-CoA synthetase (NDP forming)